MSNPDLIKKCLERAHDILGDTCDDPAVTAIQARLLTSIIHCQIAINKVRSQLKMVKELGLDK